MNKEDAKISVIVATYDEPDFLDLVLYGYELQTDPNFEVVVAEDGCSPDVARVVESYQNRGRWFYRLRHFYQPDDGFRKGRILNKAIANCQADYLIFTDGNCVPRANFVEEHRKFIMPKRYVVGTCARLPHKEAKNNIQKRDIKSGRAFAIAEPISAPDNKWKKLCLPLWRRWNAEFCFPSPQPLKEVALLSHHAACFREDANAVGCFDTAKCGDEDIAFGESLRRRRIKPRRMQDAHSVLHLEHDRDYSRSVTRAMKSQDLSTVAGSPRFFCRYDRWIARNPAATKK